MTRQGPRRVVCPEQQSYGSTQAVAGEFPVVAPTVALVLSLLASVVQADDWPQWRGPNRDGVWNESGILERFPPDGLKVRWRAPVGPGWSSPVVAAGRVYLTDAEMMRPQAKERVHCFDEAGGNLLWTYAYEATYPDWTFDPPGRGPAATPIVRDGKLYTIGNRGDLICFDAVQGDVLWKKSLEHEFQAEYSVARPSSPLIEGNLLIQFIGSSGETASSVIALDKDTGQEAWRSLDEELTNSSPIALTAGGKRQVIVWTQQSITSLDPATGTTHWREPMKTDSANAVATPVFAGNSLLIGGLMMELNAGEPAAAVLWPARRTVSERVLSKTSTPLILGDCVFSARSADLVCLEKTTGKERWTTDKVTAPKAGASIHLTPAGKSVLLFTDEGNLVRAKLTAQGYEEISRTHLLDPTTPFSGSNLAWSTAAYANGHVFARNDNELVCASLEADR